VEKLPVKKGSDIPGAVPGHSTFTLHAEMPRNIEAGRRAGELIALRVSDVDVEKLAVEVSKAIWNGSEDNPKAEAAFRSICISPRLGSQVEEYLDDRVVGYLFQTSSGIPRDASNVLERKLNTLLERLEIPKIDIKLLAKFVGKDRTTEQATVVKSLQPLWGFTASVTRLLLRWILWAFPNRFAGSVSGTAETV
jgi:hypothetical protein